MSHNPLLKPKTGTKSVLCFHFEMLTYRLVDTNLSFKMALTRASLKIKSKVSCVTSQDFAVSDTDMPFVDHGNYKKKSCHIGWVKP